MMEIKITVTAPDISEAINNLAVALTNGNLKTVCKQYGENNTHTDNTGTVNLDTTPNLTNPNSAPQTATAVNTQMNAISHSETPVNPAPVAAVVPANSQAIPTAAPQYTLEMIAKAGTTLIDAGKMNELTALLARYGVEALTTLDPAHYGTFANELRALGATI